jgi:hypothetical protein
MSLRTSAGLVIRSRGRSTYCRKRIIWAASLIPLYWIPLFCCVYTISTGNCCTLENYWWHSLWGCQQFMAAKYTWNTVSWHRDEEVIEQTLLIEISIWKLIPILILSSWHHIANLHNSSSVRCQYQIGTNCSPHLCKMSVTYHSGVFVRQVLTIRLLLAVQQSH